MEQDKLPAEETATEAVPAPESPKAPEAPVAPEEGVTQSSSFDPQLLALCVVLWVLALGIFIFKLDDMRVDWYLGNLKEQIDLDHPDMASVAALVELADDADVVGQIREDLQNPHMTTELHQRYRVMLIQTLEKIKKPEAFQVLLESGQDYDPRVRVNAFVCLTKRRQEAEKRPEVFTLILSALDSERDAIARRVVAESLGEWKDNRAVWPLIRNARDSVGEKQKIVREACLNSLRKITQKSAEELPLDLEAPRDKRMEQFKAWESWYKSTGGQIPAGQSVDELPPPASDEKDSNSQVGVAPPAGTKNNKTVESLGGDSSE